jgi:hypothetical protein
MAMLETPVDGIERRWIPRDPADIKQQNTMVMD